MEEKQENKKSAFLFHACGCPVDMERFYERMQDKITENNPIGNQVCGLEKFAPNNSFKFYLDVLMGEKNVPEAYAVQQHPKQISGE